MNQHYRQAQFIIISLVGFALLMGFVFLVPYSRLVAVLAILFLVLVFLVTLTILNLERTRRKLERHVQELNSLQAIGQSLNGYALNDRLNLAAISQIIYQEVSRLMPTDTFYLAATDTLRDDIVFQQHIEQGQPVEPSSHMTQIAQTLLKIPHPMLFSGPVNQQLQQVGLPPAAKPVTGWLSVPLLLAARPIGVIVVQTGKKSAVFDERHQEILVTIATQAAIAIENARLYAQADTALSQRLQEMDSILQTTEDGILLLDRDWHILTTNRALSEFIGLNGAVPVGHIATTWPADGETVIERVGYTLPALGADCHALVHGEKRIKQQIVLPSAPGKHIERTLTAVLDAQNGIFGWLLVLRDVTEEVELVQLRDDMTHMLVHDLRSPLFVLLGGLETAKLWLEMGKTAEAPGVLDLSHKSGKHLLSLLNDLLDFYKFEGGKIPLSLKEVSVPYLLTECHMQLAPLIAETRIDVVLEIEPELPPVQVDENYLGRVLNNLLDNAIKFTPDNGRIHLWAKSDTTSPAILIGVSDSGPGIPPEAQKRLFQKFQQGITKGARRKGTGLGLAYCKLVTEAHGGKIWVESTGIPGEGATFIIRLPVLS